MSNRFSVTASRLGWAAVLAASLLTAPARADEAVTFHYDPDTVGAATYFTALTNLANALMFLGLGDPLIISPYERDDWLRRAGYVSRPPMPEMAIVGTVYAAALPRFETSPDYAQPSTLRWDPVSFDRTLDPGAQAWALLKITSPEFHLQYHDLPENKLAGLMMIPQARAQAQLLQDKLRNAEGLFAACTPEQRFLDPKPRDQVAVLWSVSNLILASTSSRDDYWHRAYRDLVDADSYRPLADRALEAVINLPPRTTAELAIAVEALGRYTLIAAGEGKRAQALGLARQYADTLNNGAAVGLEDRALAVYGLTEAARLLADEAYATAAAATFRSLVASRWDEDLGLFRTSSKASSIMYTPRLTGAVVAALNAMRWHGPRALAVQARAFYPRFFENAVIRSGLLRASPLPLVSQAYLEDTPSTRFAHPLLPASKDLGEAAVFVSKVVYEGGRWRVADPLFRPAEALFLTNMLLALRTEAGSDLFLPEDRLQALP